MRIVARCDGGAAPNPGHGAFGYVIRLFDGDRQLFQSSHGEYIGPKCTSNEAEYTALIRTLRAIQDLHLVIDTLENPFGPISQISIEMDSLLVVKQTLGEWKIKKDTLKKLHEKVTEFWPYNVPCSISHVPRDQNEEADILVNRARDEVLNALPIPHAVPNT